MNIILSSYNIQEIKDKLYKIYKHSDDRDINLFLEKISYTELVDVLHYSIQLDFKFTIISFFSDMLFNLINDNNFVLRFIIYCDTLIAQKINSLPDITRNRISIILIADL